MSSGSGNINNVINFGGSALRSDIAQGIPAFITLPPGNLSTVTVLVGGQSTVTVGDYYGMYSASAPASQVLFQVPSGKTFYVGGIYYAQTSAGNNIQFGYATSSFAEGAASVTGGIYYGSGSTSTAGGFDAAVSIGNYTYWPVPISFPALSYPFWRPNASTEYRVIMIGYIQ